MPTFDLLNRRAHLYLGILLLPWFLMYGVSSWLVSRGALHGAPQPPWTPLWERTYDRPVPAGVDLRAVAQAILKDCDLEGAFWAQRGKAGELTINRFRFRDVTRITYFVKERRLRAEHQAMGWKQVVVRMHFRGGWMQPTIWDTGWAVLVDVVCAAIVLWVVSGLIMWWRLERTRLWGAVAVGGGIVSFALLMLAL
jgi:hypothetical protein